MRLLIIGQTPPPFGGQSINIARMISVFDKDGINYRLIRMNFSEEMNENGKFSLKKIWKLIILVIEVVKHLVFYKPDYIYYPPSGPEKIPVFRDMIILFWIRLFRFPVIFHFHAGGLSDIYPSLSPLLKSVFKFTFFRPNYSICLSPLGLKDPEFLRSKNNTVVASGVNDLIFNRIKQDLHPNKFVVLFVGVCRETKGILDFIEVIRLCKKEDSRITGRVVGKTFSEKEETAIYLAVEQGIISYDGIKTGEEKDDIFRQSNVLLFPTFFEHENFPTVILEAFSCGLPVVSTKWRGVEDQVINEVNGYIHTIHDIAGMSTSIIKLANNPLLYQQLAKNARNDYEQNYSIEQFETKITTFFTSLK